MNGMHTPCRLTDTTLLTLRMSAAYQVGLSYLSMGMRRAVAACTSPEVFFGNAPLPQPLLSQGYGATAPTDPLNLAMDSLNLSESAYPSTFSDI